MNKVKLIFKHLLIFCTMFLASCDNNKKTNSETTNKFINAQELQKSMLLKKEIHVLKKVIGDSINLSNKVVFLYNGFDCETCIDKGYEICKKIDSAAQMHLVYIISTSANISRNQLINNYQHFVYNDEHDLIRAELKYIYTPVLVKLNSFLEVDDLLFINSSGKIENESKFIKKCTNQSYN